jgi:hypothetical protein
MKDKIEFTITNNDQKEGPHEKYVIETVADMGRCVTLDNIHGFLIDLEAVLLGNILAQSVLQGQKNKGEISQSETLTFNKFTWIDDHKRTIK